MPGGGERSNAAMECDIQAISGPGSGERGNVAMECESGPFRPAARYALRAGSSFGEVVEVGQILISARGCLIYSQVRQTD